MLSACQCETERSVCVCGCVSECVVCTYVESCPKSLFPQSSLHFIQINVFYSPLSLSLSVWTYQRPSGGGAGGGGQSCSTEVVIVPFLHLYNLYNNYVSNHGMALRDRAVTFCLHLSGWCATIKLFQFVEIIQGKWWHHHDTRLRHQTAVKLHNI